MLDNPDLDHFLNQSNLFTHWTAADKQRLQVSAKAFSWSAGEVIFQRGDRAKWLYIVTAGSVKGVVLSEDGNEAIIDLAGRGQWFGGLSIIDQHTHPQTAVAMEDTHCIGLDGLLIRSILDANPALYREVVFPLCERLRATLGWIEDSLLSPIRDRIYVRLREIARNMGEPHGEGFLIRQRLSQDSLAAMLGVTRQTLNKELGALRKQGQVRKIGTQYWVKNAL